MKLVKHNKENPICAAVGDGANDVSMIQEANLGIGKLLLQDHLTITITNALPGRIYCFLRKW